MKAELMAEQEKLKAKIALLTTAIEDQTKEINELAAIRKTTTDERAVDKAANLKTIKDAQDAQEAVQSAVAVLKKFYSGADQVRKSTELEQAERNSDRPQAEAYGGEQDRSGSVLNFLEIINRDFARLESDTTAGEAEAADAFEKFANKNEVDSEVLKTQRDQATEQKDEKNSQLASVEGELGTTNEELDAANQIFAALKEECIDTGLSYEDRKKLRAQEIQSLKDAEKVLTCANDRLDGKDPSPDCPPAP
jgi:hypothetical protein